MFMVSRSKRVRVKIKIVRVKTAIKQVAHSYLHAVFYGALFFLLYNSFFYNDCLAAELAKQQENESPESNALEQKIPSVISYKAFKPKSCDALSYMIDHTELSTTNNTNTKFSCIPVKQSLLAPEQPSSQSSVSMTPQQAILTEQDPYGRNSLMLAAAIGNEAAVKSTLVSIYQQPELFSFILSQRDMNEQTAFIIASAQGQAEIVTDIIQATASYPSLQEAVLLQQERLGNNGLMMAALAGKPLVVQAILQEIITAPVLLEELLLQKNNEQLTLFMLAATHGQQTLVRDLLAATLSYPDLQKAMITQKNPYGQNSLMLASINGHNDIVDTILQAVAPKIAVLVIVTRDNFSLVIFT